jgi:hypothetical protein
MFDKGRDERVHHQRRAAQIEGVGLEVSAYMLFDHLANRCGHAQGSRPATLVHSLLKEE